MFYKRQHVVSGRFRACKRACRAIEYSSLSKVNKHGRGAGLRSIVRLVAAAGLWSFTFTTEQTEGSAVSSSLKKI